MSLQFDRKVRGDEEINQLYDRLNTAVGSPEKWGHSSANVRVPTDYDAPTSSAATQKRLGRPMALQLVRAREIKDRYPHLAEIGEATIKSAIISENLFLQELLQVTAVGYYELHLAHETYVTLQLSAEDRGILRDDQASIRTAVDGLASSIGMRPIKKWFDKELDITVVHIPFGSRSPQYDTGRSMLETARPIFEAAVDAGFDIHLCPVEPPVGYLLPLNKRPSNPQR